MGDTSLASEKYVSFTTYRKDGSAKAVPVWIAELGDGTMGFTSASSSWKVKRLANNPNVLLQPCDSRGEVSEGTTPIKATATATTGGPEFDRVRSAIKAKYGVQFALINLGGKFMKLIGKGSGTNTAVIVTV
jgi:PPOX class probable F420-dependent enzyme